MKHAVLLLLFQMSFILALGQISLVRNIDYQSGGSPSRFISFKNHLYYNSSNGSIFRSDGTALGTIKVGAGSFDLNPTSHCVVGEHLYFGGNLGHIYGLYKINGINGEIETVHDAFTLPRNMVDLNGVLLFSNNGNGLYKSDGTAIGTYQISEISVNQILPNDSVAYVFTSEGHIYETDGQSVYPLFTSGYVAGKRGEVWNNTLFFFKYTGLNESLLIQYRNGLFSEIRLPLFQNLHGPFKFFPTDNTLYFFAPTFYEQNMHSVSKMDQLWKTDGTEEGTLKVAQLGNKTVNVPENLLISEAKNYPITNTNIFYFVASSTNFGLELWRSDGTSVGTFMIKDIFPGTESSNPSELSVINGICYFIANDGVHGYEVWRSDGTEAGTYLVMDLKPGIENSSPIGDYIGLNLNNRLYSNHYALAHNETFYLNGMGQLFSTGATEHPLVIGINFTQNIGWCQDCTTEVLLTGNADGYHQYSGYSHGDETFTRAGKFIVGWEGNRWEGQYYSKHDTTDGLWTHSRNNTLNGYNIFPKPPCRGWSNGVSLLGDCVEPYVEVIGNAPINGNVSLVTYLADVSNNKNEYSMGKSMKVKWNEELNRWELIVNLSWGNYVAGDVLSYNLNNNGSNPPCTGWTGEYGLSGDICTSYPGGIPNYIYRPAIPVIHTYDKARKAIILEPGTVIDAKIIGTYRGDIKQN